MGLGQVLLAGFVEVSRVTHELDAIEVCAWARILDVGRGFVTA